MSKPSLDCRGIDENLHLGENKILSATSYFKKPTESESTLKEQIKMINFVTHLICVL